VREREPVTQTISLTDARQSFSQLINQVFRREARVLIEKNSLPVAALVSADDLERLRRYDEEREQRFRILDEIQEAFKDVPPEELEREVSRAVAQVRKEMRREAKPTRSTR